MTNPMNEDDRLGLEARLERLERQVADLSAAMGNRQTRPPDPKERVNWMPPRTRPEFRSPFPSRSIEWWLARGGAALTCLALILLYQYAVERNWITPVVRVVAGILVGGALFYSATKVSRSKESISDDTIGLREVLLGAGLAAWYITAYAAAIYYALIPVSAARLVFILLSIGGAWLALREQRSVLAFLALGTGFLTPLLLPSVNPFMPVAAVYVAALAAVGCIVYLMRGWQSIVWLTSAGFWWTSSRLVDLVCCNVTVARITSAPSTARIALTVLIITGGALLVRTPLLRRRLLATGSQLYTSPTRSGAASPVNAWFARNLQKLTGMAAQEDSVALWGITIFSPLLAVLFLSWIWTAVQGTAWGLTSLALAAGAYRLATSSSNDEEFTHVEAAATTIWSLAGFIWLADSIGSRWSISSELVMAVAALHPLAVLEYFRNTRFIAPLKIAVATASACVVVVLLSETMFRNLALSGYDAGWTVAELIVIGAALTIWWTRRAPSEPMSVATLFGLAAYLSLMLIDARILNRVWPPLVTATFAVAGAALLIVGRGRPSARTLRALGAFTLIVVVTRLFMFDLARVETIWRVVLFLGCGALFLFTSHRLQDRQGQAEPMP